MFLSAPLTACTDSNVSENAGKTNSKSSDISIEGCVTCNGRGLAGVVVSDGIDVTTTDADGIYQLRSDKKYGYVFISTPAGYEPALVGNQPQFFKRVTPNAKSLKETADFKLNKVDNNRHAVLAMADFHLARRNNDVAQFEKVAADINQTASELRAQGYRVYGVSLGDESWDGFWYSNNYGLAETFEDLQRISMPFYHCMGNHDNDPYCPDDWSSEQAWIKVCGPVYYSFNAGDVHYVVLDDIQYLNAGASQGTIGKRDYNDVVVSEEMAWLRKDLAMVKDKTRPVVVAMHAPLYADPTLSGQTQVDHDNVTNTKDFEQAFAAFSDVHVLTGHTHVDYNVKRRSNIREHNTAAVCATWWWTGKLSGVHVCTDGTPGGYGVYTWDGSDVKWYYKSSGFDKNYQFRAYDLNNVCITPSVYAPKYQEDMKEAVRGYDRQRNDNQILINVWNYDPEWKVEAFEEGRPLSVTRCYGYDPLHIIAYDAKRIQAGGKEKNSFQSTPTAHLFKAVASSATSTVNIRVTDSFGNVYTEKMERPKIFNINIR